jgi:hypothetical protein
MKMIRLTERTREKLMLVHGCSMVLLGLALFYTRATMTNLFFCVFGSAFALLLVAASLLFIGGVDWICAMGLGCRQVRKLRGLLSLSTAAAVCSLLLIFFPGATLEMLCYLLAFYALSLSAGKFSLARSWRGNKREQSVMYVLAFLALAFSVCLAGFSSDDDKRSLLLVGSYSLFMGLQMLLTMYFLQQQMLRLTGTASRLDQASVPS